VLDGLSVLMRLHERQRGRLLMPVAPLLPAGDSELLRQEALSYGAAGIVLMPYDPAGLLECVRKSGSKN
jgi:CheY-like chemotaxis protein